MIDVAELEEQIRWWLKEDVGPFDITTWSTVAETHRSKGIIHMKQSGVVAGMPVAGKVFAIVDSSLSWMPKVEDGARVEKGTVIAEVEGSTRSILKGERLALNLLQRLSGIATRTREYVDALQGMPVRLADTRKTTPGHRLLEKYAVRVGGGANHRFGLHDAVLIKDNHIKAAGGVAAAVRAAKNAVPHTMKIEVEVESLAQADEAVAAGADIIMTDNMSPAEMAEAVRRIKAKAPHIIVEASGGVTLESLRDIARTGVDVISVGRLTYSVPSLDISLDLNEVKGSQR
jgi:nicotinate-nucleotide pyrophosphorylase (carboxylating)